jgi:hypothetical protein
MLNRLGPSVHYADNSLIIRIKTGNPAFIHSNIIRGIQTSMKLALLAEDLTKEEKDALIVLNDMLTHMIPKEAHFESAYRLQEMATPSES